MRLGKREMSGAALRGESEAHDIDYRDLHDCPRAAPLIRVALFDLAYLNVLPFLAMTLCTSLGMEICTSRGTTS